MRENSGIPPPFGDLGYTLVLPPNTGTFIKWGLILIGVISLFVFLNILRGVYTDWLWFNNLGFLDVFTTILWTRTWLFIAGAAVFGAMITEDDVEHRKPDGRHVLKTIEGINGNVSKAVFIGDSETDMAAAKNAGIPAICVTYGYCHVPYNELGARALIGDFHDLPEELKKLQIAA